MSERTLEQALAHAEEICSGLAAGGPVVVNMPLLEEFVLLADEVLRLRAEIVECEREPCEHSGTPFADFLGLTNRSR